MYKMVLIAYFGDNVLGRHIARKKKNIIFYRPTLYMGICKYVYLPVIIQLCLFTWKPESKINLYTLLLLV